VIPPAMDSEPTTGCNKRKEMRGKNLTL